MTGRQFLCCLGAAVAIAGPITFAAMAPFYMWLHDFGSAFLNKEREDGFFWSSFTLFLVLAAFSFLFVWIHIRPKERGQD